MWKYYWPTQYKILVDELAFKIMWQYYWPSQYKIVADELVQIYFKVGSQWGQLPREAILNLSLFEYVSLLNH